MILQSMEIAKYIKKIFAYNELIITLAVKDFKVRYKNAVLGFLWALLNPLLMMAILSVVFSFVFKIQVDKYPVFLLTALLPWYFLSFSLSGSTVSIVENANLIKKISFAREIIPVSVVLSNLFNLLLSLLVLFVFMFIFGVKFTPLILLLPFVIILQTIFVMGISFICATLHTIYRDTKHIVDTLLLLGFYLTPVFYPVSMVPGKIEHIYMFNPMACIITIYRSILFYGVMPSVNIIIYAILFSAALFIFGLMLFRRHEKLFADYV